ncbi:hypothetical protein [Pseudomonas aeruginosa]|uniref:hypothetical protein n=1 Tax=Pseudomonas aeruginosa TaxID=287 RepID=UPI00366D10A8
MNKANECTCPSGDGSLVHPCPAHPAVEQACWDERKLSDLGNELHNLSCSIVHENEKLAEQIGGIARELWNWPQACAALAQPSPAQAEAEQPEIVAFRYRCTNAEGEPLPGWFYSDGAGTLGLREPLMAVSQHERIIGAMRAVVTQLRQHKSDYMDAGQETYWALQNEIREREAEIARLDGLVSSRTVERDAAQAEVERLRQFERICEGLPQDAIDGGWTVQGIRGYAKRLEDQLKAALAEVAGLRSLLNSLLCYVERDIDRMRSDRDKSDNKEIYDRSISLAMERLKAAQNAVFTTEPGCDTAVELAAQTTQAQHSVPEASEQEKEQGWTLDYRFVERVTDLAASRTEYTTSMEATEQVLLAARELLAAVPGKEVPQAWLDVQAERRRQITAEGWTPEHDDLYCAAELPRAAAAYILNGANDEAPAIWPFSAKWWKPRDARSNYVRAGALILAEIERLDRAVPGKEGNDD